MLKYQPFFLFWGLLLLQTATHASSPGLLQSDPPSLSCDSRLGDQILARQDQLELLVKKQDEVLPAGLYLRNGDELTQLKGSKEKSATRWSRGLFLNKSLLAAVGKSGIIAIFNYQTKTLVETIPLYSDQYSLLRADYKFSRIRGIFKYTLDGYMIIVGTNTIPDEKKSYHSYGFIRQWSLPDQNFYSREIKLRHKTRQQGILDQAIILRAVMSPSSPNFLTLLVQQYPGKARVLITVDPENLVKDRLVQSLLVLPMDTYDVPPEDLTLKQWSEGRVSVQVGEKELFYQVSKDGVISAISLP